MPMRQRIGLSLALLMLSTAALAETPKKSGAEPLIQPPAGNPLRGEARGARGRHARRAAHRRAIAQARPRAVEHHPAGMHATGGRQIGTASWYALEGSRTASGERMDEARATAAHRSLPLLSYARVTNLANGRSVVVEINDRGPLSRRFIIDLSPQAAEQIGMIRRGVAEVAVQPVALATPRVAQRVAAAE
jgi:rare lipoprotein A